MSSTVVGQHECTLKKSLTLILRGSLGVGKNLCNGTGEPKTFVSETAALAYVIKLVSPFR